jgi:hypothetical protein
VDTDTDTLWHYTRDLDGALAGTGGAIVLILGATHEAPEESYIWRGDPDESYAAIADLAAEICEEAERPGDLHLITGDDSSRRIASINREGAWRLG